MRFSIFIVIYFLFFFIFFYNIISITGISISRYDSYTFLKSSITSQYDR